MAIPYNWVFELLGAVVEVLGYFIIPFSLVMGELNIFFFVVYFSFIPPKNTRHL